MYTIQVELPFHLQTLAQVGPVVELELAETPTQRSLIAALETRYPALSGAVVDPHTGKRRPLIRFYACKRDLTFEAPDQPLPEPVAQGREPLLIVGAISGG